jgi:NitT/TauT family transport system ATP-binding protein
MDEAFSALDPGTRTTLQMLLREVWSERKPTILFVTHNTAEALVLGTRLILLGRSKDGNECGAKIVLDMKIPFSAEPISRRGQGKEFMELLEYVEQQCGGKFDDEAEPSGEDAR